LLGGAAVLLLAVVVAVGALNWLVRSEGGTRWLFTELEQRAGDGISIQSIEGTLSSGVTAIDVRIDTEAFELEIDRLRASIRLRALLDRTLVLTDVSIGQVIYRQLSPTAVDQNAGPPEIAFDIPVGIEIDQASIQRIEIILSGNGDDIEFGATTLGASLANDRLTVRGLQTTTRDVAIESDLEVEWQNALVANADFSWSTEFDGVVWAGSGSGSASLTEISFDHLIQSPITLRANGRVNLGDAPTADISLEWQDLLWPGQEQFRSSQGRAEISGWLDAINAESTATVTIEGIEFEAEFAGAVTEESLAIENLAVASDYGNGTVSGNVQLDPYSWDLAIDAVDVDPSGLVDNWQGAIAVNGRLQGALAPELQWSLTEAELSGTLLGLPVLVSGGVTAPRPGTWLLDQLDITWAGNDAFVDGSIGESMDLAVRLNAPRVGALTSVVDGQITADGNVGGSLQAPSFTGNAVGQSLQIGNASVEQVTMEGTISGIQGGRIDVEFNARNIETGRPIASDVSGSISGTTESHELSVSIDSAVGLTQAHAAGGWLNNSWIGEIDQLTLDQSQFGLWELDQPTAVSFGTDSISVARGCLQQITTSLCVEAEIGNDDERMQLALESFELSALQFLLGDIVTVDGTYDLEIGLTGPLDRPTGSLSITGASTLFSVNDSETPLAIPIDRVEIEATLNEQQFAFSGSVVASADARVDFGGTVEEIYADDPAIALELDGSWDDLSFLSLLSPDIGQVSGAATLSLAVDGSFDSPAVNGEARWIDGQIAVPQWGLVVDDVNLVVSTPDDRHLAYALTAVSGDGRLELEGTTELDPEADWPTTLSVRGNNFTAIQLPEARIDVSPNLNVVSAWPRVEVTGVVAVPFARLSASEFPNQSGSTSDDVVVHGRDAASPERPLDVRADIRVVLGDDVQFSGSGLASTLTGALGLVYRSGESSVATGTIILGGEYATLGQTLELEQGRLIFSGPIGNPDINVRAVKRYEGLSGPVVVGVLVTGSVNQPVTRLYSDPSMSDGDIVSYLVVGRPLSDSSRENSEALQAAAVSMGLTQALPQIQHFGEAIGLDELGVRASNANTGELMAGKQISPRMYMRYTYGLMNRVGGLLLRFQLSDRLSLETRTGEHKAMDLLYMVERE
jgi:translocation and assembly module TamB